MVRNVFLVLENAQPDQNLTSALNDGLAQWWRRSPVPLTSPLTRALSNSINIAQRQQLLAAILQHPHSQSVEILAAVARDSWQDLQGSIAELLECLARNEQGQPAFNALVCRFVGLTWGARAVYASDGQPRKKYRAGGCFTQLLQGVR